MADKIRHLKDTIKINNKNGKESLSDFLIHSIIIHTTV